MELGPRQSPEKMLNDLCVVLERLFYRMKINGLAFHVDIMVKNKKMNLQKFNQNN